MTKKAMITGASSGIGKACAAMLARLKYDVIVTGRRKEKLDELAHDLYNNDIEVKCLVFDVRDRDATRKAWNSLSDEWKNIHILINNAGLAAGAVEFMVTRPPHVNVNDMLLMPTYQANSVYNHKD